MRRNKADRPGGFDVPAVAQQVWDSYRRTNGVTVNLHSGSLSGKNLWAVSVHRERAQEVNEADVSVELIEAFIEANMDLLIQPQYSVGMWLDAGEGRVFLDVSTTVPNRQHALELARKYKELAICHLSDLAVEYVDLE